MMIRYCRHGGLVSECAECADSWRMSRAEGASPLVVTTCGAQIGGSVECRLELGNWRRGTRRYERLVAMAERYRLAVGRSQMDLSGFLRALADGDVEVLIPEPAESKSKQDGIFRFGSA